MYFLVTTKVQIIIDFGRHMARPKIYVGYFYCWIGVGMPLLFRIAQFCLPRPWVRESDCTLSWLIVRFWARYTAVQVGSLRRNTVHLYRGTCGILPYIDPTESILRIFAEINCRRTCLQVPHCGSPRKTTETKALFDELCSRLNHQVVSPDDPACSINPKPHGCF